MTPTSMLPSSHANRTKTMDDIERAVAAAFSMRVEDLHQKTRHAEIVWPRHIALWFMRRLTPATLHQIAKRFDCDHATVIHAAERVRFAFENYPRLNRELKEIQALIEKGGV